MTPRGLLVLLSLGFSFALPTAAAHAQQGATPPAKKDLTLEAKAAAPPLSPAKAAAWRKRLDRRLGKKPNLAVNIYNKWTHEYLVFDAGDTRKPPAAVANRFLRCHFTNEPTDMDQRLVSVLLQAAKKFKVRRVDVVSGFRAPKYNLTLRKKGRQVARNSEHTLGHAVDFRLPGIGIKKLHAWARTLRLGGVGFYNSSRFIHVDVGRVRYWNGR
ncbi:MAG: YcbK family protein [Myxococcales bacterium]|nr:YcbK family protein [Myxococcales bacterium]